VTGPARAASGAVLAADLGGTQLRVAVLEADGTLVAHEVIPTPTEAPSTLGLLLRATLERYPDVSGAVVGVPGPVAYDTGEVLRLPHLPHWEGLVTAQRLADALEVPVALANDADLGALGEQRFGAAQGALDVVYVTASTGVGAGVVLGGRLVHGSRSLAEVGFTTIDLTHEATAEDLVSGTNLEARMGIPNAALVARARAGDPEASRALEGVTTALAVAVTNLVFCFMPEVVVIGGGLANGIGEPVLEAVRARIAVHGPRMAIVPRVHATALGDSVGLYGAVALWHDLHHDTPSGRPFLARPATHEAQ
jgi:glucokinase